MMNCHGKKISGGGLSTIVGNVSTSGDCIQLLSEGLVSASYAALSATSGTFVERLATSLAHQTLTLTSFMWCFSCAIAPGARPRSPSFAVTCRASLLRHVRLLGVLP